MSREDITILLIFLSIIFLTALAGYREKKSGERKLRKKIKNDFGTGRQKGAYGLFLY